ncbi:class I SAM-dependent methyltransferase [Haloferula helveola]
MAISDTLTGRQIRALWNACNNEIREEAYGLLTPLAEVHLFHCLACGFRFFDPKFVGTAEFYQELMKRKSYPAMSSEFKSAIEFCLKNNLRTLMDVGGGEGAFLDMAREAGFETTGVELNREAAAVAAGKGHRMFTKPLEEIGLDEIGGAVDFLSLFQVIEHVTDPVGFMKTAASLVRPDGYLCVAVPSVRRMIGLLHHDPADWPPHHMSRWRIVDLQRLGDACGLKLVASRADQLTGSAIPWAWDLRRKLRAGLGLATSLAWDPLIKLGSDAYRYFGLKYMGPCHGLSLHAVFLKPDNTDA